MREKSHDHLTIHPVGDPTVSRNGVAEVLDLERPLESRREEASERRDDARKRGKHEGVHLEPRRPDSLQAEQGPRHRRDPPVGHHPAERGFKATDD